MKVVKTKHITSEKPVSVIDCFVDSGFLQGAGGSLPDVDVDYQSDRRQEVKEYIERRYNHNGKQRVFSAGTFTTLKVKAVIKDVARTMRINPSLVNYLTALFDDDKCDYTGIFKLAAENKKIAKFIHDYPILFEDIRTLMFQPRSSSVHASALLVTPDELDGEDAECFDFVPIKKVDNILVSEDDGYSLDELGLLKSKTRTAGGQRIYSDDDIVYIKRIMELKALSFSLDEIKSIILMGEDDESGEKRRQVLLSN